MFGSFFLIALINGVLTYRIRRQEKLSREREERTRAIFELTRDLSKTTGVDDILTVAKRDIKKYFDADAICLLREKGGKIEIVTHPGFDDEQVDIEHIVVEWVISNSKPAGKFTAMHADASLSYYPLAGNRISPGILAVKINKPLNRENKIFWITFLTQVSNALERELLGELALKARLLEESDKLYKTLFTLISHEFRIPIATIMGASDTLSMSLTTENQRSELFDEILKASTRLNHLVENLLNMSRLESGKISVRADWCDINDLFNKVVRGLKQELSGVHLIINIPPDLPPVQLDFGLMEQVIYNLLLNSCQNSPAESTIRIDARFDNGNLIITIADNGPGFPPDLLNKVFDKFFRVDNFKTGGLGLGLSIVKGLVEAHKGSVNVENLSKKGARFTIMIPTELPDLKNIKLEQ